jgi:tRNA(fMet)-specific endonuclease VapC
MSLLLDTDICSAFLRGNSGVVTRVQQHGGRISISAVTLGELYVLALRRKSSKRILPGLQAMLSDIAVLDVDRDIALTFGELRSQLLDKGRPTPVSDLWIAATALTHDLTLVTHNTADFAPIPGIRLDDWLAS